MRARAARLFACSCAGRPRPPAADGGADDGEAYVFADNGGADPGGADAGADAATVAHGRADDSGADDVSAREDSDASAPTCARGHKRTRAHTRTYIYVHLCFYS